MKVFKWIIRYTFLGLLGAAAALWWAYCNGTIATLQATVDSPKFIDMATDSFSDAVALLDRIEEFEDARLIGIIGVIVVAVLLVLLILWNVYGEKIAEKVKAKAARAKEQRKASAAQKVKPAQVRADKAEPPASAPETAAEKSFFCPYCGHKHAKRPAFCAGCGQPIAKK